MGNYADATFKITVRGGGQDVSYVYRPVSPQSFVAWAPPGALTTNSTMARISRKVTAGNAVIINDTTINALAPLVASYVAIVPPSASRVTKTMKGVGGDTGVSLIPYLPNIIALPNPLPSGWQLMYTMGSAEDLDIYLF